MKKAIATIPSSKFLGLLKLPANVQVVKMTFPTKDGSISITLEGEDLPVKKAKKGAKLPEVEFEVMDSWHMARISPKESDQNEEKKAKRK